MGHRGSAMVGLVVLLLMWQAVPWFGLVSPVVLPPPSRLPGAFLGEWVGGFWWPAVLATVSTYALGLLLGTVTGVVLGIATALSPRLESWLDWAVRPMRPVPAVAWLPLVAVWLGHGLGSASATAVATVAVGVLWVNWAAALSATRAVDPHLLEVAAAFGLGGLGSRLRRIILPGAAAGILAGVRAGAGLGWTAVIAAELVISPGLGQRMVQAAAVPATDVLLVYLLTIAALVALTDGVVVWLRNGLVAWQR